MTEHDQTTGDLIRHHAQELIEALENAVGALLYCARPGPGCDDATALADAVERGEAALAAVGRLKIREPEDGV